MSKIFISYRREDSTHITERIYEKLRKRYGAKNVFLDVDNILEGNNFNEVLNESINNCSVMLVIIGKKWGKVVDDKGNLRLKQKNDYVRMEVERGLEKNILVIPILVDNSTIPKKSLLPESLYQLFDNQTLSIRRNPDFNNDILRLFSRLEKEDLVKKNNWFLSFWGKIVILSLILLSVVLLYSQMKEEKKTLSLGDMPNDNRKNIKIRKEEDALKLDISLLKRNSGGIFSNIEQGGELNSKDEYQLLIKSYSDGYLYIYQKDASGNKYKLFPNNYYRTSKVYKGEKKYLPSESSTYKLDSTIGKENFYFILLKKPFKLAEINSSIISETNDNILGVASIEKIKSHQIDIGLDKTNNLEKILKSISKNDINYTIGVIHK